MGWCNVEAVDLVEKTSEYSEKLNIQQLTSLFSMIRKEKKKSLSESDASREEKDKALPRWSDLRKDLEAVSNHSAKRHGESLLTTFERRMTLPAVGSDVRATDNDSLRGSEEGDDNVEENGSHCR